MAVRFDEESRIRLGVNKNKVRVLTEALVPRGCPVNSKQIKLQVDEYSGGNILPSCLSWKRNNSVCDLCQLHPQNPNRPLFNNWIEKP